MILEDDPADLCNEQPNNALDSKLQGEKKPLTILFTDIVDSTAIAEKLDPEEWREVVSGAHRIVAAAVRHYGGTIAQFLGDGVLAFFGAPQSHEDDPHRAVRASLQIQHELVEYRSALAGMISDFQLRIGIHSGTVVISQIGDEDHMEYLAVGDAVNLAARLQSAAPPGGVLISSVVSQRVKHLCVMQDIGGIQLKGKSAPVRAFLVKGITSAATSERGISGLRSPYIGRDSELEELNGAIERLKERQGGIFFILGEAGIGKSRLLEEIQLSNNDEIHWLEALSPSYGAALSYWTICQLILHDLDLTESEPEVRIRVALNRRLDCLFGSNRSKYAPFLYHLLGLHQESESTEWLSSLGAETFKRQVLVTITAYFSAIAEHHPCVLIFEDLHWADASTLQALERLFPLAQHLPLLFVCLSREERSHTSWRLKQDAAADYPKYFTEIYLNQLSTADSVDLVGKLLATSINLPKDLCSIILERAEGNPFYIEEILSSLIDQHVLVRENEIWHISAENIVVDIPATIHGVILSRIDTLPEDVRQTVQLASVIGRSFSYRILQAVSKTEGELDWHLAQLMRVDLIHEKTHSPELEYIFKHSLTQEAVYGTLLSDRRKSYHLSVAQALEHHFADREIELSALLAHHFEAGGQLNKAITYLLQAGDRSRLENAFEEAQRNYSRAVELLAEIDDNEKAARTWLKLGLVHQSAFAFKEAHQAYEQAFTLQQFTRQSSPKSYNTIPKQGHPRIILMGDHEGWPWILDPGLTTSIFEAEISTSLFAGLAEYDLETNVIPHVARSWEILEDGHRYIFHLRDDVHWTDGSLVTAADFEWSWKRNLAPGLPDFPANLLDDIVGARRFRLGEEQDSDHMGIRALDPFTLEVRLESPVPYFIYVATNPVTFPLPAKIIAKYGAEWWKPPCVVSNGPFRLIEYTSTQLRTERNPYYFGNFSGNLDGIKRERFPISDPVIFERFLAQELDYCALFGNVPPSIPIHADYQHIRRGLAVTVMVINPCKPPLDNLHLRQAIACGLDYKEILKTSGTSWNWSGGFVPPGMPGHSPELGIPYDLPRALNYMSEAGFPDGKGFPILKFGYGVKHFGMESLIQQLYARLGIQCKHIETSDLLAPGDIPDFNLIFTSWIADYPDPNNFLSQFNVIDNLKAAGWKNPRYDQLIADARTSMDQTHRMNCYREADRILVNDEAVIIPLESGRRWGVDLIQPWVHEWESGASTLVDYKRLRLER